MDSNFDALPPARGPPPRAAITHRSALAAAMRKAAMLERLDPRW